MVQIYTVMLPTEIEDAPSELPYRDFLTDDEYQRARAFRFARDQVQYAMMHGVLRQLLSERLNVPPHEILYVTGAHGKPALAKGNLFFNITHTRGKGLIALSDEAEIGVDIERCDRACNQDLLARRVFTPQEQEEWAQTEASLKYLSFLNTWVAKEAYTKALGFGLQMPFRSFSLTDIPALHWLDVGTEYIGAVTSQEPVACILQEEWGT
jgi:4'-phosphopantetheinyl transferase